MALQFNRQFKLIAYPSGGGNGVDMSALHCVFQINHQVIETPNTLAVRIYNVNPLTAQLIKQEFNRVTILAGYPGNFGTIFDGDVKQTRTGRENPTDTYLDIFAADTDLIYNWAFINTALSAGYSQQDVANALNRAAQGYGAVTNTDGTRVGSGNIADAQFLPNKAPRGCVLYGGIRDHARVLADTNQMDWSFQNGQWQYLPRTAYLPTDMVVLTSRTGMIGLPQQTQDGISVRCLLNPAIGPGTRVKIDNKSVQQMQLSQNMTAPLGSVYAPEMVPTIAADGIYKVLFVDHVGDTRGNDWYSDMICLAVDSTFVPATQAVIETGIPL